MTIGHILRYDLQSWELEHQVFMRIYNISAQLLPKIFSKVRGCIACSYLPIDGRNAPWHRIGCQLAAHTHLRRNRKKYQVLLNSDKPSQIKCRYIFTSVFFLLPLLCQIRPLAFFYIANIKRPWVHIDCSLLQRTGYFLWFRHLPKALTGRGKLRTINFPILVYM